MNKKSTYKYEVALSFASEDRAYVSLVASNLKQQGVIVFFDEFEQIRLWGKDMYAYFDDIFRFKSKYCVMFLSAHYAKKSWTNEERKSAQARAFESNQEYILPYRFDNTTIPGIRPTISYLENMLPHELCHAIIAKIKNGETDYLSFDRETELQYFKDCLKQKISKQWIHQLRKDLEKKPNDSLRNLIYSIYFLKKKELTTPVISLNHIKKIEKHLNSPLLDEKYRSTSLFIQALIKHDFYEKRGWRTKPTSKEVFQLLINSKTLPDEELIQHLIFPYKLKQILAWLKRPNSL